MSSRVPVTILTGYLGAGKTTLLNRILSEKHGKRIAVIENEFGEIGIDQALVIDVEEEIFEMANGCLCCTVRGDLIRVLGNLMKRRDKFDTILVETTGLADPGPVAQTFFVDDDIREAFVLDGIVTVVDAKHISTQLERSRESEEQIAFADVVLLNKCDLVDDATLVALQQRVRSMNRMAKVHRTVNAALPMDEVLSLRAFDLDKTLERRPTFLEPEYPFEWSGVWHLDAGSYLLCMQDGPDPDMSVVALQMSGSGEEALREAAERCVWIRAEPPRTVGPGARLQVDAKHVSLALPVGAAKTFTLEVAQPGLVGLYTQHRPEELELELRRVDASAAVLEPIASRTWVAEHEHDATISSVAIEMEGDAELERFDAWMSSLLRDKGVDIFRMKGIIAIAGESRRFVFQGVHMLFDGRPERPWGNRPRCNQLVFIGRNLDREALRRGFAECLT